MPTYTKLHYGAEKVLELANSLTALLKDLMVNPEMVRSRFELAEDLRSIVWLKFIIYHQVLVHEISVVRILHQKREFDIDLILYEAHYI